VDRIRRAKDLVTVEAALCDHFGQDQKCDYSKRDEMYKKSFFLGQLTMAGVAKLFLFAGQ